MAPHPFTLRQLQYAVAVADTLGFRRAADLCHVSQPSLSAQLAQLEGALGVRLFERDARHVLLTAAGADLVARARRLLTEADDLVGAGKRLGDPLTGTLRIGVIPTISPYLLPDIVAPLRASLPRMTLLWIEEKTDAVIRDVIGGRLDAALLALVPGLDELEVSLVGRDPFVIAGSATDRLLKPKRPAHTQELDDARVLLLEDGHCFRDQVAELCARARAEERDFRATSLATLAQMVAGGAGITLLPELALAVENRRGALAIRRFAEPAPSRDLALVWRKQSPLTLALSEVAKTIRAAYPHPATRVSAKKKALHAR